METRVFTIEAVNALVPRLQQMVGKQLERRSEIEQLLGRLGRQLGDVPDRIVLDPADPVEVRQMKRDLVERIEVYRAGWKEVEALGAVLKDPRIGLLDFYGEIDGRLVWLCWKYGERECGFYHALEEGFSGRKPLEKQRFLN